MTTKTFYRAAEVCRVHDETEDRIVDLAFSSESPVERHFGTEILDHDPKSVRLGRLTNKGPVLLDHRNETDSLAGVVMSASIDGDRVGRATIKFSQATERARQAFEQMKEGVLTQVSVGYTIHRMEQRAEEQPKNRNGPPVLRAVDWEPSEISLVAVPADATVGIGRSLDDLDIKLRVIDMTTDNKEDQRTEEKTRVEHVRSEPPAPTISADAAAREAVSTERVRVREIEASIKLEPRLEALGREALQSGMSLVDFKQAAFEWYRDNQGAMKVSEIGMSKKEVKRFSFFKFVRALSPHAQRGDIENAAFELEASRAARDMFEKEGQKVQGSALPNDVFRMPMKRELTAGVATDGAELVATNLLAESFIDVLRPMSTVMQAGATVLGGLTGDVAIPRMSSGSAFAWWATETAGSAVSEAQFDQVTLTPKTGGAYVDISRQLTLQSTPSVEGLIQTDFARAAAQGIDLAAMYGSGASGQPTGIVNVSGIYDPSAWGAENPTFLEVIDLESGVAEQDVNLTSGAYVCRPDMKGALKGTAEDTGSGLMVWRDNMMNGYPAYATTSVTSGDLLFGNWTDLLIGSWGGLDVIVDPYTGSTAGTIRIVIIQSVDVAVRHPESFAIGNDTA